MSIINYFANIVICLVYILFGYNTLNSKSYGSLKYLLSNIFLSSTLVLSVILFIITGNYIYFYIPLIPFIMFIKIDNDIKKKLRTILYKKS